MAEEDGDEGVGRKRGRGGDGVGCGRVGVSYKKIDKLILGYSVFIMEGCVSGK